MAKYAIFFTYTPDAWASMIKNPSDRSAQGAAVAKAVGGELETFYWMLGGHDGLAIADVPDTVSAAAISVAINSTGNFSSVATHELLDADGRAALTEKAKTVLSGYTPPSG